MSIRVKAIGSRDNMSKNKDSEYFMNQTLHQNIFTSHTVSFSDATALPFREMNTELNSSTFPSLQSSIKNTISFSY